MMDDDSIINFGPWSSFFAATMTKSSLYNMIYEAIMERPSYVVLSEGSIGRKMEVIDTLIEFYEKREDYERCADLNNIRKDIEFYA